MGQQPPDRPLRRGFEANLLAFARELRDEGVGAGTSEILDAGAALEQVPWADRDAVHGALSATLAKSPEDRKVFDLVFERFFFRTPEAAAIDLGREQEATEGGNADGEARDGSDSLEGGDDGTGGSGDDGIDVEQLRDLIAQALQRGEQERFPDFARLAVAAFGRGNGSSGVIGVDVQRIRRALGLRSEPQPDLPPEDPRAAGVPREALRQFEQALRRELELEAIERTRSLPAARPLGDLDRGLPTGQAQDLADIQRVIAQMRRRLATSGQLLKGRRRSAAIDIRRTVRASLQTGGVPVVLHQRPRRPKRPELFVLCDVSTSVTSASVFFLSVLHALHDSFRKMRSFVFIERISEVTDVFERERDFKKVSRAIATDAGVADVSGYTDYGRVWSEFLATIEAELHPRATVIVLGDARTNGRQPREDLFAQIAARAGRTFWLNPEPRLYWNYGDSVIETYARYCIPFECWTTSQLGDFVEALTRPGLALDQPGTGSR